MCKMAAYYFPTDSIAPSVNVDLGGFYCCFWFIRYAFTRQKKTKTFIFKSLKPH